MSSLTRCLWEILGSRTQVQVSSAQSPPAQIHQESFSRRRLSPWTIWEANCRRASAEEIFRSGSYVRFRGNNRLIGKIAGD